jgi:hypothetical protein
VLASICVGRAFEQSSGNIQPWQTERQRRVHVEMNIDERRGDETVCGVYLLGIAHVEVGPERNDPAAANSNILLCPAVRKRRIPDDKVALHAAPRQRINPKLTLAQMTTTATRVSQAL